MEFTIGKLVGILLLIFGGAVFAAIIISTMYILTGGTDPTKLFADELLKKNYITDVATKIEGSNAAISWKQDKEITVRVYYITNPGIVDSAELRGVKYEPASANNPDFKITAKEGANMNIVAGVSKVELVAVKENKILEKKEIIIKMYNQKFLDIFALDLKNSECSTYAKCNVIACKNTVDLVKGKIVNGVRSIGMTDTQLRDALDELKKMNQNSNCRPSYSEALLEECTPDEISFIFEKALDLKTTELQNKGDKRPFGEIRQELYDNTFAKQCIQALKTVLQKQEWREQ